MTGKTAALLQDGGTVERVAGHLASPGGDGRDDVFAWQLFTVFQHHLSDDVSASLGYRYFATEDARLRSTVAPVESHNIKVSATSWLN